MDHEVVFEPSGRRIRVPSGTSLLEAARRAGLPAASACDAGGFCARCGFRILSGESTLPEETRAESAAKRANRVDPTLRLACRIALASDLTVTAPYW